MGLKKVLVIIPTTGSPELADSVRSIINQDYENTHLLLVVDGPQFSNNVTNVLNDLGIVGYGSKIFRCDLPFNTGGGGFYGHRIMAAFGHLIPDYNYVLFLDQDNWYDTNHVSSMIGSIEENKWDWCYSLRKVYDKDKNYLLNDDCESLGKWPIWTDEKSYLIDTSSYCFNTSFFAMLSHIWNFGWGADRRFYHIISNDVGHKNYGCTGQYTLNYRLGGNEGSVTKEFFLEGNKKTAARYKGVYPWKKRSL